MHTVKLALVAILAFQLSAPGLAYADPPPTPTPLTAVPPGNDIIEVLKTGQVAPHDGQLFDNATSIRWGNYLQQCQSRLKLDPLYQYKLDQADLVAAQKTEALQAQEYTRVTTDLQTKLTAAQVAEASPPFYKTFWFGMAIGIIASIAVVAGSVAILNAEKQ
jgi:hypothetical protein